MPKFNNFGRVGKIFKELNNIVKFKLEIRRFKNEKEEDDKNQFLFKKVKILHFYGSENLNLSQFQLSKKNL